MDAAFFPPSSPFSVTLDSLTPQWPMAIAAAAASPLPCRHHSHYGHHCHCCCCGHRCTHGYALRADFAPGARLGARSGVSGQWHGNRDSATQRTQQPNHHLLPSTTRPLQHIGSPQNFAGVSSKTGATDPQRIRMQQHPDPPQYHHHVAISFVYPVACHLALRYFVIQ